MVSGEGSALETRDDVPERVGLSRRDVLAKGGLVGAAALLPGLLAACGSDSGTTATGGATGADAQRPIDELSLIVPVMSTRLDGLRGGSQLNGIVNIALEPLILLDEDFELVPNLATRFEQTGPTTYEFEIRDGVEFWDGTPLTPADVVYSVELHKNPESELHSYWRYLKRVSARGTTVTVEMTQPRSQTLLAVANVPILSKRYYERNKAKIGTPGVLNMGTGPWKFETFVPEESLVYTANEKYWGGAPHIKRIVATYVTESSTALLAVRSGTENGNLDIPAGPEVTQYQRLSNVRVQRSGAGLRGAFFAFDTRKAPWDDVHVRRAFRHCIDREAVVQAALAGFGTPAVTWVPAEDMERILPAEEVASLYERFAEDGAFDLERARAELAQSSVPDGFEAEITVSDAEIDLRRTCEIVKETLKEVGIDLTIKVAPLNVVTEEMFVKHAYSLGIIGGQAGIPDQAAIVTLVNDSANRLPDGIFNVAEYENAEADKLIDTIHATPLDDPARVDALVELMEVTNRDVPYAMIYHPDSVMAIAEEYEYKKFNGQWYATRWPDQIVRV